jgi:hypothetical protein
MRGGTWFMIYQSEFAGTARSTCMKLEVDDVHATVKELRKCGVVFEEYDVPGVKTVDGVAEHASGARGAWFKDLDGNILRVGPLLIRIGRWRAIRTARVTSRSKDPSVRSALPDSAARIDGVARVDR